MSPNVLLKKLQNQVCNILTVCSVLLFQKIAGKTSYTIIGESALERTLPKRSLVLMVV